MIFDSWSIALLTCSAVTLFLGLIGCRTGLRILRHWDMASDSELQIRLEEEIWLSATLVQFGLIIAFFGALMLIFAANHYATILKGAMCATGALMANPYGIPALICKILAIFFCSLWIVLHRLDVSSPDYPLVRVKYVLLIILLPLFIGDTFFLSLYLLNLEPEIITSCCGVIFSQQAIDGYNLLGIRPVPELLVEYGVITALLVILNMITLVGKNNRFRTGLVLISSLFWCLFYIVSLVVITIVVSPYVYGMPHHRCPFDLLQYPYSWIGFPLYLFLHVAVLSGLSSSVAWLVRKKKGLAEIAFRTHQQASLLSLICLFLFLVLAAWEPALYLWYGGQR
jgi:hypothetical protein